MKRDPREGFSFSRLAGAVADRLAPGRARRRALNERLRLAVTEDSVEGTLATLKAGADPNARLNGSDCSLHMAVKHASLAICEALLDGGAEVDLVSGFGRRALHDALEQPGGQEEKTRLLLKRGANPNSMSPDDPMPLRLSLRSDESPQLTRALLEHGADPNASMGPGLPYKPLGSAVFFDRFEQAQLLAAAGADLSEALASSQKNNRTREWVLALLEEAELGEHLDPPARASSRPSRSL